MASALTPLANTSLTSTTSVITLSSISQAYKDLVLLLEINNSSTGGNYEIGLRLSYASSDVVTLNNNGGSVTSAYRSGFSTAPISYAVNTESGDTRKLGIAIHLMNYSVDGQYKTGLARYYKAAQTYANGGTGVSTFMFNKTTPITTMEITINGDSMAVGSTLRLYGVSA